MRHLCVLGGALCLLLVSCGREKEDSKPFEGFRDLVTEKYEHNVEYEKRRDKKSFPAPRGQAYSEDVVIKSRVSGKTIAYGRAFFDERGKLINISLKKK